MTIVDYSAIVFETNNQNIKMAGKNNIFTDWKKLKKLTYLSVPRTLKGNKTYIAFSVLCEKHDVIIMIMMMS